MGGDVKTIHITKTLTSSMIVELIEKYPNLEEITCAPSVYNRTSNTYIDALKQLNINVKRQYNWGAKSRSNGIEFYVLKLSNEGLTPKQISQKLEISRNRVYYLLRKANAEFDNRKRKHDSKKIKKFNEDGFSAKEISEKLDIPLRTVYHILHDDTSDTKLPIAPVTRILKNAGAQRISLNAKIALAEILKEKGDEIAQKAITFTRCEGRKTIKADDIKLAVKSDLV